MSFEISIKHTWILFLAFGCFLLESCSDEIDITPEDRIPKDSFFKDSSELNSAIIGIYAAERDMYNGGDQLGLYSAEETRSDNTNQKDGRQSEHRAVDNFTAVGGNEVYTNYWATAYNVINLANTVIERGPDIEMNDKQRNEFIGEARFLRGSTYFKLVQDFGGVPLRLEETKSFDEDNISMPKSSVDSVYNVVVNDLTFASENLPAEYSGDDVGRATSGAAYGMLGKAELQKGNKEAAIKALEQADNGEYQLLSDYSELWEPGNKNTKESLYEIQYHPTKSGSPFWNFFAPTSLGVPGGTNGSTSPNTPTTDLVEAYESGDERKAPSIGFTNDGKPYINKFKDPNVSQGNDANVDFLVLRYSDILLMLAEAKGESPESYELINKVRNRAGLDDINKSTSGTFMEKLMHERQVEFAFETQRWHDILRMDETAVELMNNHLANEYPAKDYNIDEHDLLHPIPTSEMQSNPDMEQNPGY